MFSRRIKAVVSTTAFKLAAWYSSIFILSSLALFLLAFHMLSNIMAEKDLDQLRLKLSEYLITARKEGVKDLIEEIVREKKDYRSAGFFVRLTDEKKRTLICFMPRRFKELDCSKVPSLSNNQSSGTVTIKRYDDEDVLDIISVRLPGDYMLQVGKSSTERKNLLKRFQKIFLTMLALVTIVGLASGAFMAFKALSPLRDLVQTIQKIRAGSMDARVKVRMGKAQGHDELDILARLFNEMLERIDRLVNSMKESLDYVAHDLRTPVMRLKAIVESTLQRQQDREALENALMDCAEEAERISDILSSLMDVSEAEAGVMRLDLKRQPLAPIIKDAVELYEYVAEEKNITISADIEEDLVLFLDKNRFRQVAANLIDNAIKYGKRGGRVEITAEAKDNDVVISFSDNGMGIPSEDLPRIFDRLYRGDKSRSQKGLGLGLCMVKAVVEAHGGIIEVESVVNKETVVRIFFPFMSETPN